MQTVKPDYYSNCDMHTFIIATPGPEKLKKNKKVENSYVEMFTVIINIYIYIYT